MQTLLDVIDYLESLATRAPGIESFVHGDLQQIIERERSDIAYPCLWAETPDVTLDGDEEDGTVAYDCRLLVLAKASQSTHDERRTLASDMLQQALRCILQIREDARVAEDWHLGNGGAIPLQPKLVGTDSDLGWVFDVTIITPTPCLAQLP